MVLVEAFSGHCEILQSPLDSFTRERKELVDPRMQEIVGTAVGNKGFAAHLTWSSHPGLETKIRRPGSWAADTMTASRNNREATFNIQHSVCYISYPLAKAVPPHRLAEV